jgi:tellurite methyltransferase
MSITPFWENTYSQLNALDTFGEPAEELAQFHDLLPAGASVLDLGCGEGRNALFLAGHGFQVTAVDISAAGIKKLHHFAHQNGLSIATDVQDMRHYAFEQSYDLIVAHGSLHLIEREDWTRLIPDIKAHTNVGGYNVIAVFTDTLPAPDDLKEFHVGLFGEGELFKFYDDWDVLFKRSYILEDEHPGGIKHRHPINQIVARKR